MSSRWASQQQHDPEWIYVDLGQSTLIERVKLSWEAAYATNYQIQVSNDATNWTTVRTVTGNKSQVNDLTELRVSGRYLRMYGTARNTVGYGYSLYELEVYSTTVLSLSKTATASSSLGSNTAALALDDNLGTRWESVHGHDPEWIYVDLGSVAAVSGVKLTWETAAAKDFVLETSNDAVNWTAIKSVKGNSTLENNFTGLTSNCRYVRMYGTARTTQYGYSLYEFAVYGTKNTSSPLPVSLTAFTAKAGQTGVSLQWATATETNNQGFELQRSADGGTFTAVTFVTGAGTTTTPRQYEYLDKNTLSSVLYYRLKQLDTTGEVVYTPVVVVRASAPAVGTYACYPNPATDKATFDWSTQVPTTVKISLIDSKGQTVLSQIAAEQPGANTASLDLSACPAGVYFLALRNDQGVVYQTRVLKTR